MYVTLVVSFSNIFNSKISDLYLRTRVVMNSSSSFVFLAVNVLLIPIKNSGKIAVNVYLLEAIDDIRWRFDDICIAPPKVSLKRYTFFFLSALIARNNHRPLVLIFSPRFTILYQI